MSLLIVFLLRVSFGLAAAMACVSHAQVSSGYFRNHLYVVLGFATLAALLCPANQPEALWYAVAAAVLSYFGATCWLYEKPLAGKLALVLIAACGFAALIQITNLPASSSRETLPDLARLLRNWQTISASFLLGSTLAAMLLGHWYLNAPGMQLGPLRRLLVMMACAVALQSIICGWGLWGELQLLGGDSLQWSFIALRWCFGLVGVAALIWMAWQTLKIPNTQSATGILYVAVIGCFTGEIMSQVLSAETVYAV